MRLGYAKYLALGAALLAVIVTEARSRDLIMAQTWSFDAISTGFLAAQDRGYFKENGATVQVQRGIGASDGSVLRIVVVEGVIIGLLSWLIGTLLALPLSRFLSDMVGQSIIEADLSYTFSTQGALIWLVLVLILSTLASSWPARNATRVTVRDVLAYE